MLFDLGRMVASPKAAKVMEEHGISAMNLIDRHVHGDWGDLNDEYKAMNELAVKNGSPVLSVYEPVDGIALCVITDRVIDEEGHRYATVILLPEENEANPNTGNFD